MAGAGEPKQSAVELDGIEKEGTADIGRVLLWNWFFGAALEEFRHDYEYGGGILFVLTLGVGGLISGLCRFTSRSVDGFRCWK